MDVYVKLPSISDINNECLYYTIQCIYYRQSSLNDKNSSHFWKLGSLRSRVPADVIPGETPLRNFLQMAAFSLCPRMEEKERML